MTASFGSSPLGAIIAGALMAFGLMLSVGHFGQHGQSGATGLVAGTIIALLVASLAARAWRHFTSTREG